MTTIFNELNDLQLEIENLLKFEISIENDVITIPSELDKRKLKSSLKSSLILMLYNAIEATVTKCLARIHSEINSGCLNYQNLTEPLQKLYLTYYERSISKSNEENIIDFKFQLINLFNNLKPINIPFQQLTNAYSLYSGNLDSKEISTVLKRYGMKILLKEQCLQTIKNDRNKLAHGEFSFEEIGRDLSYQQLEAYKNNTITYLNSLVIEVGEFISRKQYRN